MKGYSGGTWRGAIKQLPMSRAAADLITHPQMLINSFSLVSDSICKHVSYAHDCFSLELWSLQFLEGSGPPNGLEGRPVSAAGDAAAELGLPHPLKAVLPVEFC